MRKKTIESIQENSGADSSEVSPIEITKDGGTMDCLTVPEIIGNKRRRRKMTRRQNYLPDRNPESMSDFPKQHEKAT